MLESEQLLPHAGSVSSGSIKQRADEASHISQCCRETTDKRVYFFSPTQKLARGTQNRSSFLYQSCESSVSRIRAGTSLGCCGTGRQHHCLGWRRPGFGSYGDSVKLVDVHVSRDKLVRSGKSEIGDDCSLGGLKDGNSVSTMKPLET